jgi:hypothetical protein
MKPPDTRYGLRVLRCRLNRIARLKGKDSEYHQPARRSQRLRRSLRLCLKFGPRLARHKRKSTIQYVFRRRGASSRSRACGLAARTWRHRRTPGRAAKCLGGDSITSRGHSRDQCLGCDQDMALAMSGGQALEHKWADFDWKLIAIWSSFHRICGLTSKLPAGHRLASDAGLDGLRVTSPTRPWAPLSTCSTISDRPDRLVRRQSWQRKPDAADSNFTPGNEWKPPAAELLAPFCAPPRPKCRSLAVCVFA